MSYVLLVDDDPDARETLSQFLTKAGHEAIGVPNGREAIVSVLSRLPDVLILDLLMPEMDGVDLLGILRSYLRLQTLPVIVWTAVSEGPMLDRIKRMKVDEILLKPKATFPDIIDAIQRHVPA
jgi:CheY-like chemotaxis protein